MTIADLYTEIDFLCETNTTVFPVADKLRGINIDQGEALSLMLQSQSYRKVNETSFSTDFVSTDGLSEGDNGYNGEYTFDSSWVKPTEIYVKYPSQSVHKKCALYGIEENNNSEFDEDSISATFTQSNPYVRYSGNTLFIRPLNSESTVTDGIMVVVEPTTTTLTETTDTPVLDSIFHRWYVLKEALRYGKFRAGITRTDMETELAQLEKKIKSFYSNKLKTPLKIRGVLENFN